MKEQNPKAKVSLLVPKAHTLMARIRNLAASSDNLDWTEHALDQLEDRDLTTLDALRVLRLGDIVGDIEPGKNAGEWKCLVAMKKKGSREIGIATIVCEPGRLIIKTIMWVDE